MSKHRLSPEDQRLEEIRAEELALQQRAKEMEALPRHLAKLRKESETTMPPMEELLGRALEKEHEKRVVRGELNNRLREYRKSIVMIVLLLGCTAALIWWGLQLMQT